MTKIKLTYKENKAFFSNLKKQFVNDFEAEIDRTITDIETEAISRVPVDTGFLRSKINGEVKDLNGVVRVNSNYAAYVEFGTGTKVSVPAGLEGYASEFQGMKNGSFEDFKANLLTWMRNKGIDERYLFPIMMKILRVGVAPRPYLFPAFQTNTQKMLERLKKKINGSKQSN